MNPECHPADSLAASTKGYKPLIFDGTPEDKPANRSPSKTPERATVLSALAVDGEPAEDLNKGYFMKPAIFFCPNWG